MKRIRPFLAITLGLVSFGAHAAPTGTAQAGTAPAGTAVVMTFPPDEGLSEKFLKKLDRALENAVHDQGLAVLTEAELRASLGTAVGNQRRNQLMSCSEPHCAAEICNAIGANYILRGRVVPLYEDTAITLTLLDGRGKNLNEVQQQIKGKDVDTVSAGLTQMVSDLLLPLNPPPPPSVAAAPVGVAPSASGASPAPTASAREDSPAVDQQRGSPPPDERPTSTTSIVSWALIIGGGAAIAAGGVLTGVAASQISNLQTQYNSAYAQANAGQETSLRNEANNHVLLPVIVGGVGVAALAVGILLRVTDSSPAQVSVSAQGGPTVALAF